MSNSLRRRNDGRRIAACDEDLHMAVMLIQDSCTVDSIVAEVERSNYSSHALINAVVMSVPFRYQAAQPVVPGHLTRTVTEKEKINE